MGPRPISMSAMSWLVKMSWAPVWLAVGLVNQSMMMWPRSGWREAVRSSTTSTCPLVSASTAAAARASHMMLPEDAESAVWGSARSPYWNSRMWGRAFASATSAVPLSAGARRAGRADCLGACSSMLVVPRSATRASVLRAVVSRRRDSRCLATCRYASSIEGAPTRKTLTPVVSASRTGFTCGSPMRDARVMTSSFMLT